MKWFWWDHNDYHMGREEVYTQGIYMLDYMLGNFALVKYSCEGVEEMFEDFTNHSKSFAA